MLLVPIAINHILLENLPEGMLQMTKTVKEDLHKYCPICKAWVFANAEAISIDIQHWRADETSDPTDLATIIFHKNCLTETEKCN